MEKNISESSSREVEETDIPSRPAPGKTKYNNNQPKNKKPYSNPKPRFKSPSAKTSYAEKSLPVSLSTRVLSYYHPIHTSTSGVASFAKYVYNTYSKRDQRLEKAFSLSLLSYVSTLALTYRIYRLGNRIGYSIEQPDFLHDLKEMIQNITLPEPIAKYIEAVGKVSAPQGICFVPHVPNLDEFSNKDVYPANRDMLDQQELDQLDGLEPLRLIERENIFLRTQLIEKYMMGSSVAAKFGALFRKVDWQRDDGDISFIVAYEENSEGMTGYAPFELEQTAAQLGACYRLRNKGELTSWFGTSKAYALITTTDRFMAGVFMVEKVLETLFSRDQQRHS